METFKNTSVVLLPSNKNYYKINQILLSIYGKNKGNLRLAPWTDTEGEMCNIFQPQYLYFLSDDEIKIGDWVYCLREGFIPVGQQKVNPEGVNKDPMMKKIIATTDESLTIPHGGDFGNNVIKYLSQPPKEWVEYFISEYNSSRIIKEALVKYEFIPFSKSAPNRERYARVAINSKDNTINIKF